MSSNWMTYDHMATANFSPSERLILAITDDDVAAFRQQNFALDEIISMRFDRMMNILNFAIDQERVNIVAHLARATKDRPDLQEHLTNYKFGQNQNSAIHQVMTLGNRELIDILVDEFNASLEVRAHNELSVMHYAAQSYAGYLSILVLVEKHAISVNIRDKILATPLHFAILKKEVKNVELLIKYGADVDA